MDFLFKLLYNLIHQQQKKKCNNILITTRNIVQQQGEYLRANDNRLLDVNQWLNTPKSC